MSHQLKKYTKDPQHISDQIYGTGTEEPSLTDLIGDFNAQIDIKKNEIILTISLL